MPFITIEEVLKYFAIHTSGAYSRTNFDAFLVANKFQYLIPSIHITGTNGKGSTATMIKNIYAHGNHHVGLFTSPALERFSEMIVVDHQEIDDDYVIEFMNKHEQKISEFNLTTFEIQTYLAFSYFTDMKVTLAIIEVGMGGLIDATNIFTPVLSIITNIGIEHTNYLGPTIVDIASHKAGIIKPRVPVLIGKMEPQALRVIEDTARKLEAPLIKVKEAYDVKQGINQYFSYGHYARIELTMSARYQVNNAVIALETIEILKNRWPIKEIDIRLGLSMTFIRGRLEVIGSQPTMIIDGAHNPDGIEALVEAMKPFLTKTITIIFAAFKDKDIRPMLQSLEQLSKNITVTSFNHPRARRQDDYEQLRYPFVDDFKTALLHIYQNAPHRSVILLTGSLAFIGAVRTFVQSGGLKS